MKTKFPLLSLVFLLCPVHSWAQNADTTTQAFGDNTASPGVEGSSVIRSHFARVSGCRIRPVRVRPDIRPNGGKERRRSEKTTRMPSPSA